VIEWILLYLLQYKEAQDRAYEELRSIVGSRAATLEDKPKTHYFNAFLEEIMRHCPGFQISIPHAVSKDTTLGGFFIPKGTTVFQYIAGSNYDESNHKEPLKFNPTRFLDSEEKFVPNEFFGFFGLGKRRCMGEALARAELYLAMANIILSYELIPVKGRVLPDIQDFQAFIPGSPKDFSFILKHR